MASRDTWGGKLNTNFDVIDNLAPLASPTFTGDPKAPTPATADNDTSIATTAYVKANLATVPPFPEAPNDGKQYARQSLAWASIIVPPSTSILDTAPSSPSPGQLWYESDSGVLYIWYNDGNSSQWVQVGGVASGPNVRQTILTAPTGNYVKPAGLRFLEVTCVGGGGGAQPTVATAAGASSASGGGGGGGTSIKLYPASDLAATEPYVIGAGGTYLANGGNTTFKGLTGGGGQSGPSGSVSGTTVTGTAYGSGGVGSGGDLNMPGGFGGSGIRAFNGVVNVATPGMAGASWLAQGSSAANVVVSSAYANQPGFFPGGGASGAANGASQAQTAITGVGGAGCIILKEYF
jgi:hypothetical protein